MLIRAAGLKQGGLTPKWARRVKAVKQTMRVSTLRGSRLGGSRTSSHLFPGTDGTGAGKASFRNGRAITRHEKNRGNHQTV
jgi:hypothetical protein